MSLTKTQRNKLDDLWGKAVRGIAGNKCEMCGSINHLQAHHTIGRRYWAVRYYLSNGISLCFKHHAYAEQNGIAFGLWIIKARGEEWWQDLQLKCVLKPFLEFEILEPYLLDAIENPNVHKITPPKV